MTTAISPLTGTNVNDTLQGGNGSEVISARAGNDIVTSGRGDDEVWGGKGDDHIRGNAGQDILYGDGGPSFAALKDLVITYDHPVTVTFEWEGAGYRNTFGWYKINQETGEIYNADIIWENASRVGSGGDLVPGVTTENLDVSAGDQIGFFIVSNGYSKNQTFFNSSASESGHYEFRNADGSIAAVTDANPTLYHIAEDGTATAIQTHDYHTAAYDETLPLNSDGILHTVGQLDAENGVLELGFEDLYNGGDLDFDDTVFSVDIGSANVDVLNAHARYGANGYTVVDGQIVVLADGQSDLFSEDGSTDQAGLLDLRFIEGTNTTDKLLFKVHLYGEDTLGDGAPDGSINLFLTSGAIPVALLNDGNDAVLSNRDGTLVTVSIISGIASLQAYAVDSGTIGSGISLSNSNVQISGSMASLQLGLDDFGYSLGENVSWGAFALSGSGSSEKLDLYDAPKTLLVASYDDTIQGDTGHDQLFGMKGDDELNGGDGNDTLNGGSGSDVLSGGRSNDALNGGSSDDELSGNSGNDTLTGGKGDDILSGGDGQDYLNGQSGDDTLSGGSGNDTLDGSSGADNLSGGSGNDSLKGGSSNDILMGGTGDDTLNGGSGIDTASYAEASKGVRVDLKSKTGTGEGNDEVVSIEQLIGSDYGDKLYGNHLANVLQSADGDDRLYGRNGQDLLEGGNGDDYMDGGSGDDTLRGGDGDDELKGYKGADELVGGSGSDTFVFKGINELGDTILDFDTNGDEDLIDISALFTTFGISSDADPFDGYIQVSGTGSGGAVIEMDTTGAGSNYDLLLVSMDNFSAIEFDENQLITN
jgi:serralysin